MFDRRLRDFRKSPQQPRQHDFDPDMIVGNIEMARGRLPQRANAEDHAIAFPSLLVDLQHGNAGGGAREARHGVGVARNLGCGIGANGPDCLRSRPAKYAGRGPELQGC